MSRRYAILLIPLLLLFLVPPPVVAYEVSSESILGFEETLPDNVLFYPDSLENNTQLATDGSAEGITENGDYTDTHASDDTYYKISRAGAGYLSMTLNFTHSVSFEDYPTDGTITAEIEYNAVTANDEAFYLWNFTASAWDSNTSFSADGTYILSLSSDHVSNGQTRLYVNCTSWTGCFIWIDYAISRVWSYTSSEGFVDAFTDVSDWAYATSGGVSAGDYGIGTDTDIMDLWLVCDDTGNEYAAYESDHTDLIAGYYYLEIRYKCEDSDAYLRVGIFDTNNDAIYTELEATSWTTFKSGFDSIGVAKTRIEVNDDGNGINSGNHSVYIDYLRIAPANELGWQHDCSFDGAPFTSYAYHGYIFDGNADHLLLTNSHVGLPAELDFEIHYIDPDYYPFFSVHITSATDNDGDGKSWALLDQRANTTLQDWTDETGIFRYNMRAIAADELTSIQFRVDGVAGGEYVNVTFMKCYSLANWSYTSSSVGSDDYLYVSSGVLYSDVNSGNIIMNQDPALSVNTDTFDSWSIITTGTAPPFDHYVSSWQGYTTAGTTTGELATGTLTDVRLKFTGAAQELSAVRFIDSHAWHEASDLDLTFNLGFTPAQEWGLDILFVLAGLCMIPASTMYLVYGGKDALSSNKVFYAIVGLIVGFGLLAGGVAP